MTDPDIIEDYTKGFYVTEIYVIDGFTINCGIVFWLLILSLVVKFISYVGDREMRINANNEETEETKDILHPYDCSDFSLITQQQYMHLSGRCLSKIPILITKLNFSEDKPQNHNMYISNINSKYVHVFYGEKWILMFKDEFLDKILDIYEYEMYYLESDPELQKKYSNIKGNIDRYNYLTSIDKDKDKINNKIKEDIALLLFNNRGVPIKTSKMRGIEIIEPV